MNQGPDTKLKILETARLLFASHGFEGTSIRDIAKEANVNVASVNYYFSNKENLFGEILRLGHQECSQAIGEMYSRDNPTLEEVLLFIYRYFHLKSHDLMTYFKMMMSSQHVQHMQGSEDEFYGPPGGKIIFEAIAKEVGEKVSEEHLHWALKCLFGHVVHMSLMASCCFKHNQQIPYTSAQDIETSIRRLCRVVISELKSPHHSFGPRSL
jgi:AcrR family transcriptional regulator